MPTLRQHDARKGHTDQTVSLSVSLGHSLFTIYLGCVVRARSLVPIPWEACTAAASYVPAMLEHVRVSLCTLCVYPLGAEQACVQTSCALCL